MMKPAEAVYTLSVASELSGVPIHSIKQYIERELIIPFKKESKRHLFSEVDVRRLRRLKEYLEAGNLNIAGIKALMAVIPCWTVRSCSRSERESCGAFTDIARPCWEASEKNGSCRNIDCRQCAVYSYPEKYSDIKNMLKDYTCRRLP